MTKALSFILYISFLCCSQDFSYGSSIDQILEKSQETYMEMVKNSKEDKEVLEKFKKRSNAFLNVCQKDCPQICEGSPEKNDKILRCVVKCTWALAAYFVDPDSKISMSSNNNQKSIQKELENQLAHCQEAIKGKS
jgi:hypothetical protein